MMSNKLCALLAVMFACFTTAGCGGRGDGYSGARGTVSGTATIDGQPLQKGCQIIFISATGGYTAAGVIGDGGAYTLDYAGGGGLPAVEYQIQFTAPIVAPGAVTPAAPVDPTKMGASMKVGRKMKAADEGPIPTKYQSTNSSKMSFAVKDGDNKADFDLKTGG
jgi:hypothetical protein